MNNPTTRPMDEPIELDNDVPPIEFHQAGTGHSGRFHVDQSRFKKINDALPWVVIAIVATVACSISGVSLGLAIGSRDTANRAERESRLQRLEVDELKVALQVQGIKTHEGSTP